MRAVNLIPAEGGRAGGGGLGPYVLLGVLGLLLAGAIAYVLTNNSIVERRSELASLERQAHAAQAQAEATRPYREFAALATARVRTVRDLGRARFDWHRAFAELARVIPDDVWLTSLLGTVTPEVTVEGAGSASTSTLRAALPNPAIELVGCTSSHTGVARLISRLRLMSDVVRVSLADSAKVDGGTGGGAGAAAPGGDSGDCRNGIPTIAQFGLVVFFDPVPAVSAQPDASAATATPAVAPATPAPAATPASTGSANGSDMR